MGVRSRTSKLLWGLILGGLALISLVFSVLAGDDLLIGFTMLFGLCLFVAIGLNRVGLLGSVEGRLWDLPLTRILYGYLVLWGAYIFTRGWLITGEPLMLLPLLGIALLVSVQWLGVLADRRSS